MDNPAGNETTSTRAQGPGAAARRAVTIVLASAACGVAGAALLLAGARWAMPGSIDGPVADGGWTSRSRAWFVPEGFYSPEVDVEAGRSFSWTGQTARLVIPRLDRSQPYRLSLRVAPGRPAGVEPPALRLAVDGVVLVSTGPSNDRRTVTVEIPARPIPGAEVTLDVSNTFVPGSNDARALGVVVDEVGLAPVDGHFHPAWSVTGRAGLAVMASVLGLLLCGTRSRIVWATSAAVAAGFTLLLMRDGAFIGTYVDRLVGIGIGIAAAGSLVAVLRLFQQKMSSLPDWPTAAAILIGASALKLALFAHPLATVGDGIFQLHRAQLVHNGHYFFTSITPRPFFEFPYPVALYVAAQPFWRFFPSELDLVWLLRGLVIVADLLAGLAFYAAARRQWESRQTALLVAVLWPLARAPFEALNNANLTNAFGQSLFGLAMGVVAWVAAGTRMSFIAWALAGAVLVAAFLSHFSTVSVGVPILFAAGAALVARGGGHLRRVGMLTIGVTLVAAVVSYGAYYSHFNSVYAKTIARVLSGEGEAATRSIVAPPAVKAERWITGKTDDYGLPTLPVLAIFATGAVALGRKRRREGVTLVLAGWALVWAGLTLVGIFSPVAMRVNLAAAPVFTCVAAYALGTLSERSRIGAALATAGLLVVAWDGIRVSLIATGLTSPW